MRILLSGPTGQVGAALLETLPSLGEVVALDRSELDLAEPDSIRAAMRDVRPQVLVNAAAYTAVDRAEAEEPAALRVNAEAPAVFAEEAARLGAMLVHFSTDYVFDGEKPLPYTETDAPNPLNAYGRSKLAGELAIQRSGCRHLILRTSWVYAERGRNFLLTMLRLARDANTLRVVDDQRGAPTSAAMLAGATVSAIPAALGDSSRLGLYHMSAGGETTWCQFARAIFRSRDLPVTVAPIPSREYPSPARRPRNSVLDNGKLEAAFGIRLAHWESGLREVLARLP